MVTLGSSNKLFYITTPIFYVNSVPHVGHLYTALLADAYARWKNLKCENSFLAVGTDEHGSKIQKQAIANKKNCPEFCDMISQKYRSLFDLCDIKYSDYIRTTENRHKVAVTHFWNRLAKNGFIYKGAYNGWYSVNDENFLNDDQVQDGVDKEGNKVKVSKDTGQPVEFVTEHNYLFRLSQFKEKLSKYLQNNIVIPDNFQESLFNQIQNLQDLSVSRESSRIFWGIPVPDDPTQVIYVWLDALTNYITVAGYPDEEKMKKLWPADVHIVGKDILKFHAIYWPAFLLAANIELPKRILSHGHWLVENKKMSKSIGNVIDPIDFCDKYTTDGVRYFLLREGVPSGDNNISIKHLVTLLNAELANTYGNLYQRCASKLVNPDGVYPSYDEIKHLLDESDQTYINSLNSLADECNLAYEQFNFYVGIQKIMAVLRNANLMVQDLKPWDLVKSKNENDTNKLKKLLFLAYETLRISGILLEPIIPKLSNNLLNNLSIENELRLFKYAKLNNSKTNQTSLNKTQTQMLFKRIMNK